MNDDTEFERRIRGRLDADTEALDARVRSRLNQARHAALAEYERGLARPFRRPGVWLPAGALAAAAVLAVAVWLARPVAEAPRVAADEVTSVEDIELLAAAEGLEFYAEDAAFYEWAGEALAGQSG